MIDKSDIAKLKELPIESVAERLGLRVERHRSLCPFHDDSHPSLTFDVRRNRFKCYVCDAHGGAIDLVEKKLGLDFKDACRWLADSSNVILEETPLRQAQEPTKTTEAKPFDASRYMRYFEHPFINQAAGEFLFEKRHIDPRVVRWCRLTSWKNWLQIPYFDIEGHLTGVQWRNLGIEGPRFRFPYGSNCHIYNLPVLKMLKPGEELWIAEGCSDCWALLSSGHKAIAIPSATLLKPKDLEPLIRLSSSSSFHMFPDADLPGERLFLKLKELLPQLIRHQLPAGCKDYSDYYLSQVLTVNR